MGSRILSDTIEVSDRKRQYIIRLFIAITLALFVVSIILIVKYNKSYKTEYIKYNEKSNIDYIVYLNDNDFFEENYITTNNKYIASLIKNIKADFEYKLEIIENKKEYKYSYYIDSVVDVLDKTDKKSIYSNSDTIMSKDEVQVEDDIINIKTINIDYNRYNDLINKFISTYNLSDTESTLKINMYIKVTEENEDLLNATNMQVASLEIPLTRKTVAIELNSNNDNMAKNDLFIKSAGKKTYLLALSIMTSLIGLVGTAITALYYLRTRTDENVFQGKLNRIIYTYKGYIQKVDSEQINFNDYQSVYVNSFNDLLEIRDTLQEPILMIQNRQNTEVHFLIPSQTRIVYIFLLGIGDRKRLAEGKHYALNDRIE